MKLDELRSTVKKGFKTKRICGATLCRNTSTKKGYCKDHAYECRTKYCHFRVSRLNAKCRLCSVKDNKKKIKEIKKVRGMVDV